jgi:hypothetical protein
MAREFFQEWRLADRKASAAEMRVFQASLDSVTGQATIPAPETIEEAKRLRAIANDLFTVAMAEFQADAQRLKP